MVLLIALLTSSLMVVSCKSITPISGELEIVEIIQKYVLPSGACSKDPSDSMYYYDVIASATCESGNTVNLVQCIERNLGYGDHIFSVFAVNSSGSLMWQSSVVPFDELYLNIHSGEIEGWSPRSRANCIDDVFYFCTGKSCAHQYNNYLVTAYAVNASVGNVLSRKPLLVNNISLIFDYPFVKYIVADDIIIVWGVSIETGDIQFVTFSMNGTALWQWNCSDCWNFEGQEPYVFLEDDHIDMIFTDLQVRFDKGGNVQCLTHNSSIPIVEPSSLASFYYNNEMLYMVIQPGSDGCWINEERCSSFILGFQSNNCDWTLVFNSSAVRWYNPVSWLDYSPVPGIVFGENGTIYYLQALWISQYNRSIPTMTNVVAINGDSSVRWRFPLGSDYSNHSYLDYKASPLMFENGIIYIMIIIRSDAYSNVRVLALQDFGQNNVSLHWNTSVK